MGKKKHFAKKTSKSNMKRFAILTILLVALVPHIAEAFKPKEKAQKNPVADAKLVMTLKSDDGGVHIRTARGSDGLLPETLPDGKTTNTDAAESKQGSSGGNNGDRRSKHGGNGRKFNRNQDFNHSNGGGGGGRKSHLEKKQQQNSGEQALSGGGKRQQSLNRQQHGNGNGHGHKQQLLKSQQQHHEHQQQENKRKMQQKNDEQEIGNSKSQSTCRYTKSPWSECDRKTNTHSRTLTLKKGDTNCLPTRTIQKKCKKSCRYEKGAWSECKDGEMTRIDKLKTSSASGSSASPAVNSSCEPARTVNRKCNPERNSRKSNKGQQNNNNGGKSNKKERKNKDKEAKHQPA